MRSTRLRSLGDLLAHPSLLFSRSKVLGEMKLSAKPWLASVSKRYWRVPLDRNSTVRMLSGRDIDVADDGVLHFPDRQAVSGYLPGPLASRDVPLEPECVWFVQPDQDIHSIRLTSSGTVLLNRRFLLDTDFGSVQGLRDLHFGKRRLAVDVAIAPWSHAWGTYYEFVVHVLGKLCRIKEALDPELWAAATICYPLRKSSFERQYLSLLGLRRSSVVDTREYFVAPRSVVISNVQRRDRLVPPTRLAALRNAFLAGAQRQQNEGRRLYLSRTGWKRQVLNESEVRDVVSSYGLDVIEAIPTDVEEQIRLFGSASLIVSPHGSALANLAWCTRGTRVIELFSRSFVSDVYASMCHVLGLQHVYLVDEATDPPHWTNLHKDLTVDTKSLAAVLDQWAL